MVVTGNRGRLKPAIGKQFLHQLPAGWRRCARARNPPRDRGRCSRLDHAQDGIRDGQFATRRLVARAERDIGDHHRGRATRDDLDRIMEDVRNKAGAQR
jgi:hypothetical protein